MTSKLKRRIEKLEKELSNNNRVAVIPVPYGLSEVEQIEIIEEHYRQHPQERGAKVQVLIFRFGE